MNQPHAPAPDLTRNQQLVFDALHAAEGALSAYDILDRVREDGPRAPQQVYRALDKLIEFGLVHRLETLNAFVACCDPGHDATAVTAFSICEDCGHVSELHDTGLARRLQGLAAGESFQVRAMTLELRGACARCLDRV